MMDDSVLVVCNYKLTKTLAMTFSTVLQASLLHADPGFGELHVRMRLARGRLLYTLHKSERDGWI